MSSFESKSILKIVGNYTISNFSDDHDVINDILTFVYDNNFYQATVGNQDPKQVGGNTFSLLVEVEDFDTFDIVAFFRTKDGDEYFAVDQYQGIAPPDDFLSEIQSISLSFTKDESPIGCTQPQYPNYDCSNRYDDTGNNCISGVTTIGCTNPTACSCDELRCIGLCGVCSNGAEPGTINQYDCENAGNEWTEYCGTDNQWQCGTSVFKFYNPSPYIADSTTLEAKTINDVVVPADCQSIPIKPNISIGANNLIPDDNGVTNLQFQGNAQFRTIQSTNPLLVTINPNVTDIGVYLNQFNTISFDIDKAYITSASSTQGSVEFQNIGATTNVTITSDVNFTNQFNIELQYDDLITWKITLKNIIFGYRDENNILTEIEHQYDGSYVEINQNDTIEDKLFALFSKNFTQTLELHRGVNAISLYSNFLPIDHPNDGPSQTVDDSLVKYDLDNPANFYTLEQIVSGYSFIDRISSRTGEVVYDEDYSDFNGIDLVGTGNNEYFPSLGTDNNFNNLDAWADLGATAGFPPNAFKFEQIYTGVTSTYSFTICSDRLDNPACYDNGNPATGNLLNNFKMEITGRLNSEPAFLNFYPDNQGGRKNINNKVVHKDYLGVQNAYSDGVVQTGLAPQVKEFLYQDYNTLLLFEEDLLTKGQGNFDLIDSGDVDSGMQGRFIDIIQYETELITHVDMDFDCVYDDFFRDYGGQTLGAPGFSEISLENVVQDGRCYDTYLGTLTNLELGNGYFFNINNTDFISFPNEGYYNIHTSLNLYYDFCGIASGAPTLHEPNSDTDDNAFCIDDICVNGITEGEQCFTDGTIDDICFGNCCLYPNEIVDFYEADEGESVGNMNNNRLRLCDDVGDEYITYRCPVDDKKYPSQETCTCTETDGTDVLCNEIKYYREANDCDGFLDCFDNCHEEMNGDFAEFDKYGICCKTGEMDAEGKCFGNASTEDCGFDYSSTSIVNINVSDFTQDEIDITMHADNDGINPTTQDGIVIKNTGTFKININTIGNQVSEVVIPSSKQVNIIGAQFGELDGLDISVVNNPTDLDFNETFNISITNDNNILITSLYDNVFFSSNDDIPIIVSWELNLPNSTTEDNNDGIDNYENFCIPLNAIEVFKYDTSYGNNITISNNGNMENGCFIIGDSFQVYGCNDEFDNPAINESYYCQLGGDSWSCNSENLCEYIGCDGNIYNDYASTRIVDFCGVCGGTCVEGNPNSCVEMDCNGDCYGEAFLDECGVCSGGNSGHVANIDKDFCGQCPDEFGESECIEGQPDSCDLMDLCGVCYGNINQPSDCNGKIIGDVESECCGCDDTNACNYSENIFSQFGVIVNATQNIFEGGVEGNGFCLTTTTYYLDGDGDGLGCDGTGQDFCPDNPIFDSQDNPYVLIGGGLENAENCSCSAIQFDNDGNYEIVSAAFDDCGICNGSNECKGCIDSNALNNIISPESNEYYDSPTDIYLDCAGNDTNIDTSCCIYISDVVIDWLTGVDYGVQISGIDNDGDESNDVLLSDDIIIYEYAGDNFSYVDTSNSGGTYIAGYTDAETAIFTDPPQIYNTTYFPNGNTDYFIYQHDSDFADNGEPLYDSLQGIYNAGYGKAQEDIFTDVPKIYGYDDDNNALTPVTQYIIYPSDRDFINETDIDNPILIYDSLDAIYQGGIDDTYFDLFVTNLSQPDTTTVEDGGLVQISYDNPIDNPDGGLQNYVTFLYQENHQYSDVTINDETAIDTFLSNSANSGQVNSYATDDTNEPLNTYEIFSPYVAANEYADVSVEITNYLVDNVGGEPATDNDIYTIFRYNDTYSYDNNLEWLETFYNADADGLNFGDYTSLDDWLIDNTTDQAEADEKLPTFLEQYCTDVTSDNVGFLEAELAKIVLGDDGYTQNQYDIVDDDNSDPDYAIFQYDATKSYVVPDADNVGAITTYLEQEASTNEEPNPATGNETYIIFEYQTGVDADGDGNTNPYQYVDLYFENVNYFEAKLSDLGNPATPQIYNLGSLDIPSSVIAGDVPDYHVFEWDERYEVKTTLHQIYEQGYNDGDVYDGSTDDVRFLEQELNSIVNGGPISATLNTQNYTPNQYENRVVTPEPNEFTIDYAVYVFQSNHEYVNVSTEQNNFLNNQQTNNVDLQPAQVLGQNTNFIIFPYEADFQYILPIDPSSDDAVAITNYLGNNVTNNEDLNPAQDNNQYIIFEYQTDYQYVIPSADNQDAIDLFLYNQVYNGGDNYHQYDVFDDLPGVPNGNYEYAIFEYDDNLDDDGSYGGATTLDAIYQAGITAGQTDTFQDLDNVEFLETELANIVAGIGYTPNQYDAISDFNPPDYYVDTFIPGNEYVNVNVEITNTLSLINFGEQFTNYGNTPNGYALFQYDDNLDTDGLYAGATTLNEIYLAGQTDTFQDEDNNQAIEDFIKEAIDSQEGNTFTTTPGSDPINVAIFEHNPNANVSYNASDTEALYADETAAFNAGVTQGISQSQIQYPDIYIRGGDINSYAFTSYPVEDSYWINGGNSILDNLKQQNLNGDINLTTGDTVITTYVNESGVEIYNVASWDVFTVNQPVENKEWFIVNGDFSIIPRGYAVWLGFLEENTLNWSNGLQQAQGITE